MQSVKTLTAAMAVSLTMANAMAADLGQIGTVYPLSEPDLMASIMGKLKEKEASGEIKQMQDELVKRAEKHVRRPPPVAGLGKVMEPRSWEFDPTVVVQRNLADHRGRVFARAGQVVNPLNHMDFRRQLLFINGDDRDQVSWALRIVNANSETAKVILVNGDISEGVKAFGRPVYFDQQGFLVRRFGIENVPTIVHKVDGRIMVEEKLP